MKKQTRAKRAITPLVTAPPPPAPQPPPPPLPIARRTRMTAAAISFFVPLVLYVWTCSRFVGPVDSGALVVAAATGGVAHPPGFPLFLLLGRLFSWLPVGSTAFAVNLLSAVTTAGMCLGLYLCVSTLTARCAGAEAPWWGVAAALAAMSALDFWSWATIAEVYGLSNMLVSFTILAVIKIALANDHASRRRWIIALALFGGLGAANHTSTFAVMGFAALIALLLVRDSYARSLAIVALAGATSLIGNVFLGITITTFMIFVVAALVYRPAHGEIAKDGRALALTILALILPLSLYLTLILAARGDNGLNWGNPETLEALKRHVSGWQYREFFSKADEQEFAATFLKEFLPLLLREWSVLGMLIVLPLIAIASAFFARFSWRLGVFFVVLSCASAILGCLMRQSDDKSANFAPVLLTLVIGSSVGAAWLTHIKKPAARLAPALIPLLVLFGLVANYSHCNRRADDAYDRYARNVAAELPAGALLLSANWQLLYPPLLYLRKCEGFRPDLVVWDPRMFNRSWYLESILESDPQLAAATQSQWDAFRPHLENFEAERPYDNAAINATADAFIKSMIAHHAQTRPIHLTRDIAYAGAYDSVFYEAFLGRQLGVVLLPQGGQLGERMAPLRLTVAALRIGETEPPMSDAPIDAGAAVQPGGARNLYHLRLRDQEYPETLRRRLLARLAIGDLAGARDALARAQAICETGTLIEASAELRRKEGDAPAAAAAVARAAELYRAQADEWERFGELGRNQAERYRKQAESISPAR